MNLISNKFNPKNSDVLSKKVLTDSILWWLLSGWWRMDILKWVEQKEEEEKVEAAEADPENDLENDDEI